ncbi:hypothetical protein MACH26_40440 [Planctobacterium marinum]|uniref:Uncharacterized protein n=1 Tax=Planctobacterium marinum TaxID=1631968 RepID=A0AA48KSE4_9ALTE|nr:hypothetical protein MACH26_40440 [Planctobacterium marinum]
MGQDYPDANNKAQTKGNHFPPAKEAVKFYLLLSETVNLLIAVPFPANEYQCFHASIVNTVAQLVQNNRLQPVALNSFAVEKCADIDVDNCETSE